MLVPRRGKSLLLCIGNVILGKAPACSSGSTACRLNGRCRLFLRLVNDELVFFKSARIFSGPFTKGTCIIKLKHMHTLHIHALYVNIYIHIYNLAMFAIFAWKFCWILKNPQECGFNNCTSNSSRHLDAVQNLCCIHEPHLLGWKKHAMNGVFHNHPCQPQVA